MFRSATLKLTAWYVGILMLISVCFSLVIFHISQSEVDNRLIRFQGLIANQFPHSFDDEDSLRNVESSRASVSLTVRLVYLNIGVLVIGSAASYFLARRTLKPIEEAHEAEVRFVSDASHELRTPLAIMKSELETTLRDPQASKQELREILTSNLEEVNNLSAMSETLLKMSQLDQTVPMKTTDMQQLVSEAIARFKQPDKRIKLEKPSTKASLKVSPELIQEAIVILIDNALKYSPVTSLVAVNIKNSKDFIAIAIENQGPGIDAKNLDHIFDRFYRSDRSRTSHESVKGFGLGLALAKQIVELHGGYISATSAPQQVTTFSIFLPKHS